MTHRTVPRTALHLLLAMSVSLIPGTPLFAAPQELTLAKALEIAQKSSPDIIQQEISVEQTRMQLEAQRMGLRASLTLNLTPMNYSQRQSFDERTSSWFTSKTKNSSAGFSLNQPIALTDGKLSLTNQFSWQNSFSDQSNKTTETFDNNISLKYTQPLFQYNQTKMTLQELEWNMQNAEFSYIRQKLSMEQSITSSFYSLYQTQNNLKIAQEDLAEQQKSYDIIKNKVAAGISAIEELYQSDVTLANSKLSLQNAEVSLQNAYDSFNNRIGLPIGTDIVILADDIQNVSFDSVAIDLDFAIAQALANRLELKSREITLAKARNSIIKTKAQNAFKGDLSLSYGLQGNNEEMRDVYDDPTKSQTVGISLTVPVFDWGVRDINIKNQLSSYEGSLLSAQTERDGIIINIRSAYRNIQKLAAQIGIERQKVRNAQLTYDINVERYKNGDLTSMDMNDYQKQLTSAKQSSVQAIISYNNALLEFKILTLFDFKTGQPVLPGLTTATDTAAKRTP